MQTTWMLNNQGSTTVRGAYKRGSGSAIRPANNLELFDLLLEYRLMNTHHIYTWLERDTAGKQKDCRDKLQKLFNKPNAYIDRIDPGYEFIKGGGARPMIYALNEKGRRTLIQLSPDKDRYAGVSERVKNKGLNPHFIKHALLRTEVVTNIFKSVQQRDEWLLARRSQFWDEMLTDDLKQHPKRHKNNYYGWPIEFSVERKDVRGNLVTLPSHKTLEPDDVLCLIDHEESNLLYLFLEVDRGTETEERKRGKLDKSDIWRKYFLYNRSAELQLFRKYLSITSPFFILFVAPSKKRMENMVAANKSKDIRQGRGWNRFLFATREELKEYGFLDTPWRNGENDKVLYFRDYTIHPVAK